MLVVAAVAVAAFGAAVVELGDDARRGCVTGGPEDPAYKAELVGPAASRATQHEIAVTHLGQPVRGAKVCASVSMLGMEAMGVSDEAEETAPGVYRVDIAFEMSGPWGGTILITDRGRAPVSVPVRFEVT